MRKILLGVSMFVCVFACKNPKSNIDSSRSISAMVDSARSGQVDTLVAEPVEEVPKPIEADELFDDFIFYYATDTAFQRQRTVFPLPYYKGDTPLKIEKSIGNTILCSLIRPAIPYFLTMKRIWNW